MTILDRRLRSFGHNEAKLDLSDAHTTDVLRGSGLSLRPVDARDPVVLRWRLFGEALVLRVTRAMVGVHPPPASRDVPFYLAYTSSRANGSVHESVAALVDGGQPSELPWSLGAPITLVGIRRSPFGAPLTVWRGQLITTLSIHRTGTLTAVTQFADALVTLRQAPGRREQHRAGDILVQMVTHLALSTWDEHAVSPASATPHLATAALGYIAQYYTDPSLSPQRVAQSLGVSLRTLQVVLANVGTTPARKIALHRLGHAAHCLSDPIYDDMTVAQIAQLAGFINVDTFRRAFARHFGASPVDYRRRSSTRVVRH